jgi:hypothetical protein
MAELQEKVTGPLTTDELLDHVMKDEERRVEAFIRLAGGAAQSSKTLTFVRKGKKPAWDRFDVYHSISDCWEEVSRQKFKKMYGGEDGKVWFVWED